ncbi:hypothetical protein [Pseudomonas psychrophila]|uniref:hypothetical protein n=1 Tax=Pseudomonas psychrophila TaxID=122355 RepID=UPI00130E82A5|nr:hypothetical protein [Pseudomonas psychrophila]
MLAMAVDAVLLKNRSACIASQPAMAVDAVLLKNRSACIASKPAPTFVLPI